MKKIKKFLLIAAISLALVGCGAQKELTSSKGDTSSQADSSIVSAPGQDSSQPQEQSSDSTVKEQTTTSSKQNTTSQSQPQNQPDAPKPTNPPNSAPPEKISVSIVVNWDNARAYSDEMANRLKAGDVANATLSLPAGSNAMQAVQSLGLNIKTSGSYISGIQNLFEKDCGSASGWMYQVNGKFPNKALSSYVLQSGDVIKLGYTINGGRDLA